MKFQRIHKEGKPWAYSLMYVLWKCMCMCIIVSPLAIGEFGGGGLRVEGESETQDRPNECKIKCWTVIPLDKIQGVYLNPSRYFFPPSHVTNSDNHWYIPTQDFPSKAPTKSCYMKISIKIFRGFGYTYLMSLFSPCHHLKSNKSKSKRTRKLKHEETSHHAGEEVFSFTFQATRCCVVLLWLWVPLSLC